MSMKLADAYVEIGAKTGKFERKLTFVNARLKKTGESFKKMAKTATIAFTVMAAAATYSFAKMLGESVKFEEQLARVSTMLTSNVNPQMDEFKKSVAGMALAFGDSTKSLTDGLYDILSAQIAAGKALGVLEVGARAAVAGFTDTSTTISTLLTVLKSFKMEAGDAEVIADKLFMVVAQGRTEFSKIAPVLGRATGMAGAAGLSFDELAASLATATRNGILVEQAITGLMAISRTFLKPQQDAADAAEKAGFQLNKQWLATHSLREAIERINKTRKVSIEQVFAESEAMNVAIAISDDLAGFTKDLELITHKATGRMAIDFEKASKTMAFQTRRLKGGFLAIGKALTEGFMLKLKPLVDEVNKRMPQIVEAFEKVGGAIAEITEPILKDLIERFQKLDAKDIQEFANTVGLSFVSLGKTVLATVRLLHMATVGFSKFKGMHFLLSAAEADVKIMDFLKEKIEAYKKGDKAEVERLQKLIKVQNVRKKIATDALNNFGKTEEAMARFEKVLDDSETAMDKWKKKFSETLDKDKKETKIEMFEEGAKKLADQLKKEEELRESFAKKTKLKKEKKIKEMPDEKITKETDNFRQLFLTKFNQISKDSILKISEIESKIEADLKAAEKVPEEKRERSPFFTGMADAWKRIQEAISGSGKEATEIEKEVAKRKQEDSERVKKEAVELLAETKKSNEILEKIEDKIKPVEAATFS